MAHPSPNRGYGITRRGFLLGATTGLVAGGGLTYLGMKALPHLQPPKFQGTSQETRSPTYAMPGPFPGRVIEVRNKEAVYSDHTINAGAVETMVQRGMASLTGTDPKDPVAPWKRLFSRGDIVGIKVNPVGRKPLPREGGRAPHAVGSISSPELLIEVVKGLKSAGVRPQDIIVFDRYADQFIDAEYDKVLQEPSMQGVKWLACSATYSNDQVDIEGFDRSRRNFSPEFIRHVAGYDPDVFATMGYCAPDHDPKDDRRFRSHLSVIATRLVDKIINLPVLKDHRSAGVTLALKNLSHGMNNNVARSHLANIPHGLNDNVARTGPNQCNTFIPRAISHHALREKVVLHIMDGLIGVYEGGPGSWNQTWSTWHHCGLFFATDPVAMDHVGWDIIDRKRAKEGWPPVGQMGLTHQTPQRAIAHELAAIASASPCEALTLAAAAKNRRDGLRSEIFDLRTPQHIRLAGGMGLGTFDAEKIDYRLITTANG